MGKTIIIKGADFSTNAISDSGVTKYTVTYVLTNMSKSGSGSVNAGSTLSVTLTASEGYSLPSSVSVTYTSGGSDVPNVTYNSTTGALVVASVNANITITASGVASGDAPGTYTLDTNSLGTQGGINANTGAVATNYDQWIYTKGIDGADADGYIDISDYDSFALTHNATANSFGLAWYDTNKDFVSGIIYKEENSSLSDSIPSGVKYCRFCSHCKGVGNTDGFVTLVLSADDTDNV